MLNMFLVKEEPLEDLSRYQHLVRKLNYLTMACANIAFVVSVISQFLKARGEHLIDLVPNRTEIKNRKIDLIKMATEIKSK